PRGLLPVGRLPDRGPGGLRRSVMRVCAACGNPLAAYVRADRMTCSDACRKRLERARVRGVAVTGYQSQGMHVVTDNPPPGRPPGGTPGPSKYTEEELRIPDDLTIPKFLRREPDAPHWPLYQS